jgi:hypothetical protein
MLQVDVALNWLSDNGIPLPADLHLQLEQKGLIRTPATHATKQAGDIASINADYHDAITEILTGYFENGGSITSPRNEFKRAMSDAFVNAFEAGWVDGGQELPLDDEALEWLAARQSEEFGFIDSLFQEAKELRREEEFDYFSWITARADRYTSTVLSVYNSAVMLAGKKVMGTWRLGNTEKHCKDCLKLDGQRHKLSWFLGRGYVPRKPGSATECGGYNCDCSIEDDDGNELTM